jgi:myosin heavy subunit
MAVNVNEWVDGLKREELLIFSLKYLKRTEHYFALSQLHQKPKPDSTVLVDTVNRLKATAEGKLIVKALQDAVRQERARRLRESKGKAIKRLSLNKKVCSKLAQLSRQTERTQSSVVEGLILEEIEFQKVESLYLKDQRKKLKELTEKQEEAEKNLGARERDLQARLTEVSTMEEELSVKLGHLAVVKKLVNKVKDLDVDGVRIALRFESGGSVLPDVDVEAGNAEQSDVESLRLLCSQALEGLRRDEGASQEQEEC